MSNQPLRVNCPTCSKTVLWNAEHQFKPFCSERCKLIDLGAWADEQYAIPAQTPPDDLLDESLLDEDFDSIKNR